MRYVLRGIELAFGDRRLRPFLWKPWLWSLLIFLCVLVVGYLIWLPFSASLAQKWGVSAWLGATLGTVIYAVFWIFASGVVFLSLAGLLSSLLWDGLSIEVEKIERGYAADRAPALAGQIWDTLIRLPFVVFIVLSTLLFGWTCFGTAGVLLAGWLGLYDYTACAYLRRQVNFVGQFGRVFRSRAWFGFAVLAGLVTLIPFLNVLFLPALVAGGTLLCMNAEDAA
ncbi:MAG: EI24 domain-containing protein [Fimbriimonadaceae bacterium]|nr:EI24 domain-containing protein [Fimbriimonadaceae bacterium]